MNDAQRYTTKLIAYEICNREFDENPNISVDLLKEIYDICAFHSVANLAADALYKLGMSSCSDEIFQLFKNDQYFSLIRCEQINRELKAITEVFEKSKIRNIPLKGAVLRNFYPEPWMRTSCDIDVLVKKEELDNAINILVTELGYVFERVGDHDASLWAPSKIHIELHYILFEKASNADKVILKLKDYISPADGKKYQYVMNDEMFYFYHVAHMAKHFKNGGCGIRTFIDMWILRNKMDFVFSKRKKLLEEGGLLNFALICEQLSDVWFSNAAPNKFTEIMQEYIFKGGSYGSFENFTAVYKKENTAELKFFLARMFVPYSILKIEYPIIKKYKVLTPFAAVWRWGVKALAKKNRSNDNPEISNIQNDDIKELLDSINL